MIKQKKKEKEMRKIILFNIVFFACKLKYFFNSSDENKCGAFNFGCKTIDKEYKRISEEK